MVILETKKLQKNYGSGDTLVKALDQVDLQIQNGEFVAIVGTSGSGKSTLLHMLGGLDRPTEGKVFVPSVVKMTVGIPPSIIATSDIVEPRSIPIALLLIIIYV